jgi:hypothetical protein
MICNRGGENIAPVCRALGRNGRARGLDGGCAVLLLAAERARGGFVDLSRLRGAQLLLTRDLGIEFVVSHPGGARMGHPRSVGNAHPEDLGGPPRPIFQIKLNCGPYDLLASNGYGAFLPKGPIK